jgi:glutamate--cysteine ligase
VHLVDESDAVPLSSVDELVAHFREAGKPRDAWRVGSEHELIGVRADGTAPGYDGPDGIGTILDGFARRGWQPVVESGHVIALIRPAPDGARGGESQITIEPGGQLELASPPLGDDGLFRDQLAEHVATLGEITRPLGLSWLSTGFRPWGGRADVPWMPKDRYAVMRAYMPTVGSRGLDMMLRTATVQVNLDFSDEADARAKMRALMSVTSIMTAIWASSPIVEGAVSGFQSHRAWIWRDTDNARAGLLPFVFDEVDVFRAYAEWALDVPMYFVYRGGYRTVPAGLTFRRFMAEGWEGARATRSDWALHLSTLFPEVRMKTYIEVRGCDCGSLGMIAALAPFCRGLLHDADAIAAATALTAGASFAERQQLADDVPRAGFAARIGGRTVGELARELIAIVKAGLARGSPARVPLLAPIEEIVATGRTQSDAIVDLWRATGGDPSTTIPRLAHPGLGAL